MAHREVAMWAVLEVLRRVGRGENRSVVGRATGHSRETVSHYVATTMEQGWTPRVEEPTEELAVAVYARHQPTGERGPEEAELPYRASPARSWP
jgi:hypothetical protein